MIGSADAKGLTAGVGSRASAGSGVAAAAAHLGQAYFRPHVLPNEKLGGPVVELLARLFADLDAGRAAAGASLLRLGQIVHQAFTAKVGGQGLASVAFFLGPRGHGFGRHSGWRRLDAGSRPPRSSNKPG